MSLCITCLLALPCRAFLDTHTGEDVFAAACQGVGISPPQAAPAPGRTSPPALPLQEQASVSLPPSQPCALSAKHSALMMSHLPTVSTGMPAIPARSAAQHQLRIVTAGGGLSAANLAMAGRATLPTPFPQARSLPLPHAPVVSSAVPLAPTAATLLPQPFDAAASALAAPSLLSFGSQGTTTVSSLATERNLSINGSISLPAVVPTGRAVVTTVKGSPPGSPRRATGPSAAAAARAVIPNPESLSKPELRRMRR
jgi:hypothetical protein